LTIENYALIGKLKIEFDNGLNLLTGETGAGKSIIIGALSTVLGERATTDVVRAGEEKAYVEASFDITGSKKLIKALPELGIDADTTLIMSREILSAGRTQARINGRAVTQATLRSISKSLIDIHGQHEHQSLLDAEYHIDLLDNLGGKEVLRLRDDVGSSFMRLENLKAELNKLEAGKSECEKQIDYIKYQIKEIDEAGLKDGEDEELKVERDLLSNAEKLSGGADEIKVLISGGDEGGSLDKIRTASAKLKELSQVDKSLTKLSKSLDTTFFELDDISREVASYLSRITSDPAKLEEVEERLELIRDLKKKYGESIKEILKTRERMAGELCKLEVSDERIEELRCEVGDARCELGKKCTELSQMRKTVAKEIEKGIKEELSELNMPKVKFEVKIASIEDAEGVPVKTKTFKVGPKGIDDVEFLISPNPGELLKPLAKIASGGEISRVMLALKSILSKADEIPTMIFDEIDAGIGGQTAVAVGKKLSSLSKARQIICITHLPQIASRPGRHLHVSKSVEGNRTQVFVKELKADDRVAEVANLLGGKVSEATLKTAKELISGN
jgi:DNA repair protein RecN (Recombination protein N)